MRRGLVPILTLLLAVLWMTPASSKSLEVWSFTTAINQPVQQLISQYKKSTGIDVNLITFTNVNDRNAAIQRLMDGNGPDMLIGSGIAHEYLVPVNKLMESWPERKFMANQFIWHDGISGNTYYLPGGINLNGVSFFKSYFKEAGLDVSNPPQSWERLLEATTKLTKTTVLGRRAGFESRWDLTVMDDFLTQNNAGIVSEDGRHSLLNSPEAKQSLAFIVQLFQASRDYTSATWANYSYRFPLEAAMSLGPTSQARTAATSNVSNMVGAFVVKRCSSCVIAPQATVGHFISIPRTTKNVLDSWSFVTWYLSPDINTAVNAPSFLLPPRLDTAAQVAKFEPLLADWYKLLPNSRTVTYSGLGYEVLSSYLAESGFSSQLRKVLCGEIDSEFILEQMHREYQSLLNDAWAKDGK